MKKALTLLFFCFLSFKHFAGCTGPYIYTDNGITSGGNYFASYTVFVNPGDSFVITITRGNCYNVNNAWISLDGIKINTCSTNCQVKLPCTPGNYIIYATNFNGFTTVNALFIAKPKVEEIPSSISDPTYIQPTASLNPEFLIYPNPATDELTLLNESDEIKKVSLYNFSGQFLDAFVVNNIKASLPLHKYPSGIYFIHVATLSEKIIIKKISVL